MGLSFTKGELYARMVAASSEIDVGGEGIRRVPHLLWGALQTALEEASGFAGQFDVKAYGGAVGDGVTDDTDAITGTIAAAKLAGFSVVFFPPGVYLVSARVAVAATGMALIGCGRGISTLKMATGAGAAALLHLGVTDATNTVHTHLKVSGLTLDANNAAALALSTYNVASTDLEQLVVANATSHGLATDSFNDLLNTSNAERLDLRSIRAIGNGGDGFHLKALRESFGTRLYATGSGGAGFNFAPYIESSDPPMHGVWAHNQFGKLIAQGNTGDGFIVDAATRSDLEALLAESNGGVGVSLASSFPDDTLAPGPNSIAGRGWTCRYNDGGGVIQADGSFLNRIQLSDLKVAGETGGPDDLVGLHVKGATNVQVTTYEIFNMSGNAVVIENGTPKGIATDSLNVQLFSGRLLTNGKVGSSEAYGIKILDGSGDVSIIGLDSGNAMTKASGSGGLDSAEIYIAAGVGSVLLDDVTLNPAGGADFAFEIAAGAEDAVATGQLIRLGNTTYVPTVASASTLTVPPCSGAANVSGTTAINNITPAPDGTQRGFRPTNAAGLTFNHAAGGSGQILFVSNGNVAVAQNRIVWLTCIAGIWYGEQ